MNDDVVTRMELELQSLLDAYPDLGPIPFTDGTHLVALLVDNGVPKVFRQENSVCTWPGLDDLHGTPAIRIYKLMQSLDFIREEENETAAAAILMRSQPPDESEERPTSSTVEAVHAIVSENATLQNRPDEHGMSRHLAILQQRRQDLLGKHPDLEPLRLRTARETVEISTRGGELCVRSVTDDGQPFVRVQATPQVQLYLVDRSIRGLAQRLSDPILETDVAPESGPKVSQRLIQELANLECENLTIPIRRSKTTLFIRNKAIHYGGRRWSVSPEGTLAVTEAAEEPSGCVPMEYAALPAQVQQLLSAFFSVLSAETKSAC